MTYAFAYVYEEGKEGRFLSNDQVLNHHYTSRRRHRNNPLLFCVFKHAWKNAIRTKVLMREKPFPQGKRESMDDTA